MAFVVPYNMQLWSRLDRLQCVLISTLNFVLYLKRNTRTNKDWFLQLQQNWCSSTSCYQTCFFIDLWESFWWLFGFPVEFPFLSVATMLRGSKFSLSHLQTLPVCRTDTYDSVFLQVAYLVTCPLISSLWHLFHVFIKHIEGPTWFFFSVIYWMVLKHFKQILSTRWSDFTAKAFSFWKGGCCTAWLNDVNISGLQLAFATALEVKVAAEKLEILICRYTFLYDYKYFLLAAP